MVMRPDKALNERRAEQEKALLAQIKAPLAAEEKQHILTDNIDYIYSEHKGVDHFSWNNTYTDSMVLEWMFSKRRRINGIVEITDTSKYKVMDEMETLHFSCSIDTLDVVLSYSANLGYSCEKLGKYSSGIDSIAVNKTELQETPLAQFRIQLINDMDEIIGTDYTGQYKVDKETNGAPWLRYYSSNGKFTLIDKTHLNLMFNTLDVDDELLTLNIYYKYDDTVNYQMIFSDELGASFDDHAITLHFDTLPYGNKARIKFELSDGVNTVTDSTVTFKNPNNKPSSLDIEHAQFKLYPNPASDFLSIQIDGESDSAYYVELIQLNGIVVFKEKIPTSYKLPLKGIVAGSYLVKVYNEREFMGNAEGVVK
ncbi:MAG: T9SS type A sorting domain-containing protein [Bacteroidales bacterium]|nr:T9SS type A sorting domain-containing protein [Bacteroidales bacterium]